MQNVKIEPFKLVGISVRTINKEGKAATEIGGLWQKFMSENLLNAIPNKVDNTIYSLYTEYDGDHTETYTAMLGCKVENLDEIPEGMTGKSFEGGNYIKTTAKGDLTKGLIVNEWENIWKMDIERVFTADFEVFGEKAQNPLDAEVDFLVAVK